MSDDYYLNQYLLTFLDVKSTVSLMKTSNTFRHLIVGDHRYQELVVILKTEKNRPFFSGIYEDIRQWYFDSFPFITNFCINPDE
jgi:hypothetical protein